MKPIYKSILGVTFIIGMLSTVWAQAPNPGHEASEIGGGTFDSGNGEFRFPGGLKVGIGAAAIDTLEAELHVKGSIVVKSPTTGNTVFLANSGRTSVRSVYQIGNRNALENQGSYLRVGEGWSGVRFQNTGDVALIQGGNVGIGTTSPSEKLDVNGNVRIGGLLAGGTVCAEAGTGKLIICP